MILFTPVYCPITDTESKSGDSLCDSRENPMTYWAVPVTYLCVIQFLRTLYEETLFDVRCHLYDVSYCLYDVIYYTFDVSISLYDVGAFYVTSGIMLICFIQM